MKNWYAWLIIALFSTNVSALDWDTIGEVDEDEAIEEVEEEEVEEEAPAPKKVVKKKVVKKKVKEKKKSKKRSKAAAIANPFSLSLWYNPLAGQQGINPAGGLNPTLVEGNTIVTVGYQFKPKMRALVNLGYSSSKPENGGVAGAEVSLISIGAHLDYMLKQSKMSDFYFTAGFDYLMAASKDAVATTTANAYIIALGVGSEYSLTPEFSVGVDLRAKYGVGTKAIDVPAAGSPEIKNTNIWLAPALRLTWSI
jgi:hypothetical protein